MASNHGARDYRGELAPDFVLQRIHIKRAMMHISKATLMLTLAVAAGAVYGQGAPVTAPSRAPGAVQPAGEAAPTPASAAPVVTASSLLKLPLAVVQDTLNGLKLDKWKKGSVREEAGENVASLLKDLQTNLPPLLTASDVAPGRLSQAIPLVKHMDAFYDVMLRVEEAARVVAPGDQVDQLQQSLLKLNQARLALDDHLQADAVVQEKQVGDLQVALKTQQQAVAQAKTAAAQAPIPCKPAATPVKKKKPAGTAPAKTTTPSKASPSTTGPGTSAPGKTPPAAPPAGQKPPPGPG